MLSSLSYRKTVTTVMCNRPRLLREISVAETSHEVATYTCVVKIVRRDTGNERNDDE